MYVRFVLALMALINATAIPLEASVLDSMSQMFFGTSKTKEPTIKILIAHDIPSAYVDVKGKYHIYDPNSQDHISTRFIGKQQHMQAISGGLKWGEEFPDIHQLQLVSDDPEGSIAVNGMVYPGAISVYDIGGTISIVNEIKVEEYLSYVLNSQFTKNMPHETLAAIAIAARTNAYWHIEHSKTPFWHVDARKAGYEGNANRKMNIAMQKAIEMTRYMVLSKTGTYEGVVTSFPANWGTSIAESENEGPAFARISLFDAKEMATRGDHAAKILSKAFPDTTIVLGYKRQ